jgi:hypothetical protein
MTAPNCELSGSMTIDRYVPEQSMIHLRPVATFVAVLISVVLAKWSFSL